MIYVNARAFIERTTAEGTELLLQLRQKPGEPERLELPGGRLDLFEPVLAALKREVKEETGLTVVEILDDPGRTVTQSEEAQVECLRPFFIYQTIQGPVDSAGFYFRVRAEGELTAAGDGASGHRWLSVRALRKQFSENPESFDWLTQAALDFYLRQFS